jgi:hypothetical protein
VTFASVYLHIPKEVFVIPTNVKTEAGFYLELDPVEILRAHDVLALATVFGERFTAPVKTVPTPDRHSYGAISKIPMVRAVRAKSYTDFVRNVLLWHIWRGGDDGFEIHRMISPPGKNYFEPFESKTERLAANVSFLQLAETLLRTVARTQQEEI